MLEIIYDEILPQALMIGVDYDLFWTLNPKSLKPFIKAFELSEKQEDMIAWRSGMYIKLAIGSLLSKEIKYPTRPLSADNDIVLDEEEFARRKMNHIKQTMLERMVVVNSRFKSESR